MAGFYPLGYEFVMKDSFGAENQMFPWYTLFKQHSALGSDDLRQCERFMLGVDIICESQKRQLAERQNVGALVRQNWIEREQLERHGSLGWTRKAGVTVPRHSKEDNKALVKQVLTKLRRV